MLLRSAILRQKGLANVFSLRKLSAVSPVERKQSPEANAINISDPKSVAEHKATMEALLKEELPKPYDGPERDHVNFPRRQRLDLPGKVRFGVFPDEWFTFFYKKTGVTGPYLWGTGLITFLVSKEWYVIEEEVSTGVTLVLLIYIGMKKFGTMARQWVDGLQKEDLETLESQKRKAMQQLEDALEKDQKAIFYAEGEKTLCQAKRENVQMQLETEYRRRMMNVYEKVKRRLDFHTEFLSTKRKLEQKHMVDWIVNGVVKSITPQQEKEALQKCIDDLKALAVKA